VGVSRFNRTRLKTERARDLRRDGTNVEMRLWQKLRNRQLGVDFRRQHPAGNFYLDFYAPALRLAVELDGVSTRSRRMPISGGRAGSRSAA
jgi:very-short-patch-repair endonuclease